MTSMQPMWWFALPVLLLPLWWHLQKRERTRTEPLATARFLPAAAPRQQRVPRLVDVLLLLARLLLLIGLIAWLAVLAMPWKGDTVFIEPSLESDAWAIQQIRAAGMSDAAREPLPADIWPWLALNEHAWHPTARLLIVARSTPMPALPPRLAHAITVATATATPAADSTASTASATPRAGALPQDRHVVVASTPERMARWQALFAAFGTAGEGAYRYVLSDTPTRDTELIVWDRVDAQAPAAWQAPLWWRTIAAPATATATATTPAATATAAATAAATVVATGTASAARQPVLFTSARTQQGLTWSAPQWPLTDTAGARQLYEQWQRQSKLWPAYPMPEAIKTLPAQRKSPLPATLAASPDWLAIALMALFAAERMLAHVRRR
jgi:hypothetical protein